MAFKRGSVLAQVLIIFFCFAWSILAQDGVDQDVLLNATSDLGARSCAPNAGVSRSVTGFASSPEGRYMECLTTEIDPTLGSLKQSSSVEEAIRTCSKSNPAAEKGKEYFYWKSPGEVNKQCFEEAQGEQKCIRCPSNTCNKANCHCCGQNIGMNYPLPKHSGNDYYGALANFKRNCKDLKDVTSQGVPSEDCYNSCSLYNKANLPGCGNKNDCIHLVLPNDNSREMLSTLMRGDLNRYMLVPGVPSKQWGVRGVDDEQNQSEDGEMTLTMAWHSAYNPYGLYYKGAGPKYPPSESSCDQFPKSKLFEDLPVADDAANIGIAFNPATIRSVHQLHIHIGYIPGIVRSKFRDPSAFVTWQKVIMPRGSDTNGAIAYARYFKVPPNDGRGWHGPHEHKVFKQLLAFAGNSHLQLQSWGVFILPDHTSIKNTYCAQYKDNKAWFTKMPKGFYLVISAHSGEESWNSYCPFNGQFVPEWYICTKSSACQKNCGQFDGWWKQVRNPGANAAECPLIWTDILP